MYNWNYDGQFGQAPMPRPSGSADRSPLFPSPGVAAQPYTICVRKLPRTFFLTSLVPLGPDEGWFRTNAYNTVVVREWWGDDEFGRAYCTDCRKRATVNYVMIVRGPNIQYVDIWDSIYESDPNIRRFENPVYLARVGGFPVQMVNSTGGYTPSGEITLALTNGIGQDGLISPSVELPVWNQGAQQWVDEVVTDRGVVFETDVGRVPLAAAAPGRGMLTLEEMATICKFGKLIPKSRSFAEVAAFGADGESCHHFYPKGEGGCQLVCDGEVKGPCTSGGILDWLLGESKEADSRPRPTPMRTVAIPNIALPGVQSGPKRALTFNRG